jgi:hypothetical protein
MGLLSMDDLGCPRGRRRLPAGYRGLGAAYNPDAEAEAAVAAYQASGTPSTMVPTPYDTYVTPYDAGSIQPAGPRISNVSITPVVYPKTIPVPSSDAASSVSSTGVRSTVYQPGSAAAREAYAPYRSQPVESPSGFAESFARTLAIRPAALQLPAIRIAEDTTAAQMAALFASRKKAPSAFDTWAPRVAIGVGTTAAVVAIGRAFRWW